MSSDNTVTAQSISTALARVASAARATSSARFFKTGKGEYGEGDVFVGVAVPMQRKIAKEHDKIPHKELLGLLSSKVHEERLTALFILVRQYQRGTLEQKDVCYMFFMKHRRFVNNWDLVDSSAHQIAGAYLLARKPERKVLYGLAASKSLWERRIAIISTYAFILDGEYTDTFALAERLLDDTEDLMHKAVGWMLREVGKRVSADKLRGFLKKHVHRMPRTALRYAIEHFDAEERKSWLSAK